MLTAAVGHGLALSSSLAAVGHRVASSNLFVAFRFPAAQVSGPQGVRNRSKIVSIFNHVFDRFLDPFWVPLGLHFGALGRPSWPKIGLGRSFFQKK